MAIAPPDLGPFELIPPSDPRVNTMIAPFNDNLLKEYNLKDRQELSDKMFEVMIKYGGIGLTCNQIGLPFNMFVMGGHSKIENGKNILVSIQRLYQQVKNRFYLKKVV